MSASPCLYTSRLRLRPLAKSDLDANLAMDLDPEVYPYSSIDLKVRRGPVDATKLRAAIRPEIASGPPRFGIIWAVEWKHQPGFVGLVGLLPCPQPKSIALSFRLVRSEWDKGLATEAARAAVEY